MKIKRFALQTGVIAGVILGMKYVFPVMLPFLVGWILAEVVHPLARYMAGRKWSKRLHIKESGFGAVLILLFTVLGIGAILMGAEYLTGKIGECIKYFPRIKAEAAELFRCFCRTVSIRERENPGLQRQHLPLRFRGTMTEFDPPGQNVTARLQLFYKKDMDCS